MTHYLSAPPSSKGGAELTADMWNKQVDGFDVARFADQVVSTGAKYLLFTIGQNSGHYCSPNATYDRIVGIQPSKCSRRDLVADLAKALAARNIRLMVYLPSGDPAADPVARQKLGWRWGRPGGWQRPGESVGGRLADFQRNWEAVIREWSLHWGKSVSGWWIDGCYFADQMYRFDDEPNFASFARASRRATRRLSWRSIRAFACRSSAIPSATTTPRARSTFPSSPRPSKPVRGVGWSARDARCSSTSSASWVQAGVAATGHNWPTSRSSPIRGRSLPRAAW